MVNYCTRCLMPNTRPRIVFDNEGICNACHTAEMKKAVDWDERRREFLNYVAKYRSQGGAYDCIVPWSGGKDSSYIAHRLKFEFGLNPLLVTFSPLQPNDVGVQNRETILQLGFDHLIVRPNQKVARQLAKRFFVERGNPKVAWDAGINAVPVQVAVNYRIPLIFYAEHGESEYGGRVLNRESCKIRDITEVLEHQIGDHPSNWVGDAIAERDLAPYLYPEPEFQATTGIKALYFAYFFRWSMLENYQYIREHVPGFRTDPTGRSSGTFTDFDSLDDKIDPLYYYLQYIKFGFGRATRDACRMVSNAQMTRAEGLSMALKYDAEFPAAFFEENLEYLGLSKTEFTEIVDLHRNREIWERRGGNWELRFPPR